MGGGVIFLGAISLCRVVVPSQEIVTNLPRTYEKLHCTGEPIESAISEILRYRHTNISYNISYNIDENKTNITAFMN